jgi:ribonuclease Z
MPKLYFLGTSNAVPNEQHENTHMLMVGEQRVVLIDCGDSPLIRFKKIGMDFHQLSDLILTHFHPDHVSGVPQLLMNMWLMGRIKPLNIFGLQHTLDRIENMMGLYNWSEWPGFFPVLFHRLPMQDLTSVLECEEFNIRATPMQHFIPSIGIRIEFQRLGKVLAYSSDTEPCPQIIPLAACVDVLIHEASGALPGHSSAAQAGRAASLAKAKELYLIHYPSEQYSAGDLAAEARTQFEGPVTLAEDFGSLEI